MSFSDDSSRNSLDTLRSNIFSESSAQKLNKKKTEDLSRHSHAHNKNSSNNYSHRAKENQNDRTNLSGNKTALALESELLGTRLTEEIKRLRGELNQCSQQKHDAVQLLQAKQHEAALLTQTMQQENDLLRARNKELEFSLDSLQRDMQTTEGSKDQKLKAYEEDLQKSTAENHRLRDDVLCLKSKLADAEELGLRLARSVELSQHEADAARQQQGAQQEGRLQHFLAALKQKDGDINALTRTVQDLRLENSNLLLQAQHTQQLAQEHTALKRQFMHQQQVDLMAQSQQDQRARESGDARVHDLERQVQALTNQRTYLKKEKADLEDQCLHLQKENTQYESRIFDLRQKYQSQAQTRGDLMAQHSAELEASSSKNRDLIYQLNTSKAAVAELTSITGSQDDVIHKLRVELSVLQDKYATLKRLNMQLLSATSTYENILQLTDKR